MSLVDGSISSWKRESVGLYVSKGTLPPTQASVRSSRMVLKGAEKHCRTGDCSAGKERVSGKFSDDLGK